MRDLDRTEQVNLLRRRIKSLQEISLTEGWQTLKALVMERMSAYNKAIIQGAVDSETSDATIRMYTIRIHELESLTKQLYKLTNLTNLPTENDTNE